MPFLSGLQYDERAHEATVLLAQLVENPARLGVIHTSKLRDMRVGQAAMMYSLCTMPLGNARVPTWLRRIS
jgi:hypothetical protein